MIGMPRTGRRIAAVVLVGLAACAPGQADAGRRTLRDHASGLPAQGALYGAGIGAAAGCATVLLDGDDRDLKHCLRRAAAGGALGAAAGVAAGYVVQRRSDRHALAEAALGARLREAGRELDDARRAGDDARRAVRRHEAELARLEDRVARGGAGRAELVRAAAAAREDAGRIRRARDGAGREVARLEAEMAGLRGRGVGVPAGLARARDELRRERDRLDRQLWTLTGVADAAGEQG